QKLEACGLASALRVPQTYNAFHEEFVSVQAPSISSNRARHPFNLQCCVFRERNVVQPASNVEVWEGWIGLEDDAREVKRPSRLSVHVAASVGHGRRCSCT